MPSGVYEREWRKCYPPEVIDYLKAHASDQITRREMVDMVRRDVYAHAEYERIRHLYHKYDLPSKSGREACNHLFTSEQAEYLASIVPGRPTSEVVKMMNEKFGLSIRVGQIQSWKKNHKTPSGYNVRYQRGNQSWTKGKKWDEWMPEASQMKSRATQFRKGQRPANYRPVGTIVCRPSNGYLWIKVQDKPAKWRMLQRVMWEEHNGPVPAGYRIMFKDNDPSNCVIENLMLVDTSILSVAQCKIGMTNDPDINETVLASAELLHKLTQLSLKRKEEKSKGKKRKRRKKKNG